MNTKQTHETSMNPKPQRARAHYGLVWLQWIPGGSRPYPWGKKPRAELTRGIPRPHLVAHDVAGPPPIPRPFPGSNLQVSSGRGQNPRGDRESTGAGCWVRRLHPPELLPPAAPPSGQELLPPAAPPSGQDRLPI